MTRIAQLAYDAALSITNVSGITINGVAADFAAPSNGVLLFGSVALS